MDDYLTSRWVLFTSYGRVPVSVSAEHEPWPLHPARIVLLEQTLIAAAGRTFHREECSHADLEAGAPGESRPSPAT